MLFFLKKHSQNIFPNKILSELNNYQFSFNPSFAIHNEINCLGIRLCKNKNSIIESFLFLWSSDDSLIKINISKFFKEKFNLHKVADPKVFSMNSELWCTFNNGYVNNRDNIVMLFKLSTDFKITEYYECVFSDRARIEKNWGFFYKDDGIHCLYSISPLIILKANKISDGKIFFKIINKITSPSLKKYSIGTPLCLVNQEYIFIAHKKIYFKGKRIYFGLPMRLSFKEKKPKIYIKNHKLAHSIKSLLGAKFKFNNNLISCTYFSGLYTSKNEVFLSYGINDVNWNIIKIKIRKLWY